MPTITEDLRDRLLNTLTTVVASLNDTPPAWWTDAQVDARYGRQQYLRDLIAELRDAS